MARRYDSRTTMFSPEGRLFQVEYALAAVANSRLKLSIRAKNAVVFAGEMPRDAKLLENTEANNFMYRIDDHIVCIVGGLASDAEVLVDSSRRMAQQYLLQFGEPQPLELLVKRLADVNQGYTQFGSYRPFGTALMFAGWDKYQGLQIFQLLPSGNYRAKRAHAMGNNAKSCIEALKAHYSEQEGSGGPSGAGGSGASAVAAAAAGAAGADGEGRKWTPSLEEALKLSVKALGKSLDMTLTPERIDFGIIQVQAADPETVDPELDRGTSEGMRVVFRQLTHDEKVALLAATGPMETDD